MNREYHKIYSKAIGKELELLVFGHFGKALMVFPCSEGRF